MTTCKQRIARHGQRLGCQTVWNESNDVVIHRIEGPKVRVVSDIDVERSQEKRLWNCKRRLIPKDKLENKDILTVFKEQRNQSAVAIIAAHHSRLEADVQRWNHLGRVVVSQKAVWIRRIRFGKPKLRGVALQENTQINRRSDSVPN